MSTSSQPSWSHRHDPDQWQDKRYRPDQGRDPRPSGYRDDPGYSSDQGFQNPRSYPDQYRETPRSTLERDGPQYRDDQDRRDRGNLGDPRQTDNMYPQNRGYPDPREQHRPPDGRNRQYDPERPDSQDPRQHSDPRYSKDPREDRDRQDQWNQRVHREPANQLRSDQKYGPNDNRSVPEQRPQDQRYNDPRYEDPRAPRAPSMEPRYENLAQIHQRMDDSYRSRDDPYGQTNGFAPMDRRQPSSDYASVPKRGQGQRDQGQGQRGQGPPEWDSRGYRYGSNPHVDGSAARQDSRYSMTEPSFDSTQVLDRSFSSSQQLPMDDSFNQRENSGRQQGNWNPQDSYRQGGNGEVSPQELQRGESLRRLHEWTKSEIQRHRDRPSSNYSASGDKPLSDGIRRYGGGERQVTPLDAQSTHSSQMSSNAPTRGQQQQPGINRRSPGNLKLDTDSASRAVRDGPLAASTAAASAENVNQRPLYRESYIQELAQTKTPHTQNDMMVSAQMSQRRVKEPLVFQYPEREMKRREAQV